MNILIQRKIYTVDSTLSDMLIDGKHFGYVLEPTCMCSPEGFSMLIPEGTYNIGYYNSPHFGQVMPRVMCDEKLGVILLHWGNSPKDTKGCSVIGNTFDTNYVGESRKKFAELEYILEGFTLKGATITYAKI